MKTTHLTSLTTSFNPFARHAKTPRLFLSLLPPAARSTVKVTVKQLPRSSTDPSTLEIGFKDGKVLKYQFRDPVPGQKEEGVKLKDVVEQVERHSRGLQRKEELTG
jgi:large subunit ribosomal protein L53